MACLLFATMNDPPPRTDEQDDCPRQPGPLPASSLLVSVGLSIAGVASLTWCIHSDLHASITAYTLLCATYPLALYFAFTGAKVRLIWALRRSFRRLLWQAAASVALSIEVGGLHLLLYLFLARFVRFDFGSLHLAQLGLSRDSVSVVKLVMAWLVLCKPALDELFWRVCLCELFCAHKLEAGSKKKDDPPSEEEAGEGTTSRLIALEEEEDCHSSQAARAARANRLARVAAEKAMLYVIPAALYCASHLPLAWAVLPSRAVGLIAVYLFVVGMAQQAIVERFGLLLAIAVHTVCNGVLCFVLSDIIWSSRSGLWQDPRVADPRFVRHAGCAWSSRLMVRVNPVCALRGYNPFQRRLLLPN